MKFTPDDTAISKGHLSFVGPMLVLSLLPIKHRGWIQTQSTISTDSSFLLKTPPHVIPQDPSSPGAAFTREWDALGGRSHSAVGKFSLNPTQLVIQPVTMGVTLVLLPLSCIQGPTIRVAAQEHSPQGSVVTIFLRLPTLQVSNAKHEVECKV